MLQPLKPAYYSVMIQAKDLLASDTSFRFACFEEKFLADKVTDLIKKTLCSQEKDQIAVFTSPEYGTVVRNDNYETKTLQGKLIRKAIDETVYQKLLSLNFEKLLKPSSEEPLKTDESVQEVTCHRVDLHLYLNLDDYKRKFSYLFLHKEQAATVAEFMEEYNPLSSTTADVTELKVPCVRYPSGALVAEVDALYHPTVVTELTRTFLEKVVATREKYEDEVRNRMGDRALSQLAKQVKQETLSLLKMTDAMRKELSKFGSAQNTASAKKSTKARKVTVVVAKPSRKRKAHPTSSQKIQYEENKV